MLMKTIRKNQKLVLSRVMGFTLVLNAGSLFTTRISPPRAHDAPPPAISSERVLQILQLDIQKCVMYDDEGFLPIHRAVLENNLKLVKRWLMAMKFHNDSDPLTKDERYSCLQLAVLYEVSPGIFSSLLSAGCCPLSSQACDLPSALHLAAQHHDPIPLQTLLDCMDKGCNINVGDDNGDTPLMTAVKHQRVENMLPLLEYVEESRASQLVNFPNLKTGFTPLAMVANINMTSYGEKDLTEESKNIIRILHRYGADPEHEDFKGNAVLGNSCKEKNNKFEAFWESLEGNSI